MLIIGVLNVQNLNNRNLTTRYMENKTIQESSVIQCKDCGKTVTRYLSDKYPNGKDKRWVDEHGKQFCGHTCPGCKRDKVALLKRLKTKARQK